MLIVFHNCQGQGIRKNISRTVSSEWHLNFTVYHRYPKSLPKQSHWMKTRSLAANGSHWINIFIRAQFKTTSTSFHVTKEARRIQECHVYQWSLFLILIFVPNNIDKTKIVTFIVTKVSDSDTNMLHDCYCSSEIRQITIKRKHTYNLLASQGRK